MLLFLAAGLSQAPCILSAGSFLGLPRSFVHSLHVAFIPQNQHVETFLCWGVSLPPTRILPTALLLYHSGYGLREFSPGMCVIRCRLTSIFRACASFHNFIAKSFVPIYTRHFCKGIEFMSPLPLFFIAHRGELALSIHAWWWGYPLWHSQPSRDHTHKAKGPLVAPNCQ